MIWALFILKYTWQPLHPLHLISSFLFLRTRKSWSPSDHGGMLSPQEGRDNIPGALIQLLHDHEFVFKSMALDLIFVIVSGFGRTHFLCDKTNPTEKTYKHLWPHRTHRSHWAAAHPMVSKGLFSSYYPFHSQSHRTWHETLSLWNPRSWLTGADSPHPWASSAPALTSPHHEWTWLPSCVHRPWSAAGDATRQASPRIRLPTPSSFPTWNSKAIQHSECLQFCSLWHNELCSRNVL